MSWAGASGFGMWIVMVVLLALVWATVLLIVQAVTGGRNPGGVSSGTDPGRILEQALASGTITAAEFERQRQLLTQR
jgi:uncharacterized membrane protein